VAVRLRTIKKLRPCGVSVFLPVKDNVFDGRDNQEHGMHMNEKGNHILTMKPAQFLNRESLE
jgi:hypothetical protein